MSNADRRLDKLYSALTAKERALLLLQAMKEDRDEDRQVRGTMPIDQMEEFNHHIFLMNSANFELGLFVFFLYAQVGQLETKLGWLATVKLWGMVNESLVNYILVHTKETITQSEYERRIEEARAEMVPVSEPAEMLVETHEGWTGEDLEDGGEADGEPVVTDAAWERVHREKEKEIARLVKDGVLEGKGRGRRLRVKAGSFYDWLGDSVPVFPDWVSEYEVLPDEQEHMVELERVSRDHAQNMSRYAPRDIIDEDPPSLLARIRERESERVRVGASGGDDLMAGLLLRLMEGVRECHRYLRAVELVVAEVSAEFGGEDPLIPMIRGILDGARRRLDEAREEVQLYVGEFDVPDPGEEYMENIRAILARAEKLYL